MDRASTENIMFLLLLIAGVDTSVEHIDNPEGASSAGGVMTS